MKHLHESGRDQDTLIFFFSDNGGAGHKPFSAYNTGFNRPLRGDKSQTLEGGIRVPFFVSWPGKLPAGKVYDQPVIALDILPTALAATRRPVPKPDHCNGVDLMPYLKGQNESPPHEKLFWRFGPQKAVRRGSWKLVDWRELRDQDEPAVGSSLTSGQPIPSEQHDVAAASASRHWSPGSGARGLGGSGTSRTCRPLWHGDRMEDPTQ